MSISITAKGQYLASKMIDIHIEMWLTDHSNSLNKSCICTKIRKHCYSLAKNPSEHKAHLLLQVHDGTSWLPLGSDKSLNHDKFSMIHSIIFQNTSKLTDLIGEA
jgi:hypothetical protein